MKYDRSHRNGFFPSFLVPEIYIYVLFIPRHTHYDTLLEKGLLDSLRSNVAYLGLYRLHDWSI
jgi:hypothetical protein